MSIQVYGIDLAKGKFDVNWLDSKGRSRSKKVDNTVVAISAFLSELPKQALICAEHTGVYGEFLVNMAQASGIPIALVPGYEIKHSLGLVKGKDDATDAQRIRRYAEKNMDKLKLIEGAGDEGVMHELRELHVLRNQLINTSKRLQTAEVGRDNQCMRSLKASAVVDLTLTLIKKQIDELEKEMERLVRSHAGYKKNYMLMRTVIGIGPVISVELLIKTENFKRIDTAAKAASFAGVCPFPNSSGKMVKKSKVSHLADKKLKSILYLGSLNAIQHNKDFRRYYDRKKEEGKPHFLIMNNLSNKLLRIAFSVVQNERPYDMNYLVQDPRIMA